MVVFYLKNIDIQQSVQKFRMIKITSCQRIRSACHNSLQNRIHPVHSHNKAGIIYVKRCIRRIVLKIILIESHFFSPCFSWLCHIRYRRLLRDVIVFFQTPAWRYTEQDGFSRKKVPGSESFFREDNLETYYRKIPT